MASKIEICNFALAHLGADRITSFSEGSNSSQQCVDQYDIIRQAMLREFPWSFAKSIGKLAIATDAEIAGYEYVYGYPSKCLKLHRIFDEDLARDDRLNAEYDLCHAANINEKVIATDLENAYAEFTADIDQTDMFDASFTEAFSYRLAAALNNNITGNAQRKQEMLQEYNAAMMRAYQGVATERFSAFQYGSRYRDARNGFYPRTRRLR